LNIVVSIGVDRGADRLDLMGGECPGRDLAAVREGTGPTYRRTGRPARTGAVATKGSPAKPQRSAE
jgi:hypothetical protein